MCFPSNFYPCFLFIHSSRLIPPIYTFPSVSEDELSLDQNKFLHLCFWPFFYIFTYETWLSFVFSSLVYVSVMYKQGQVTQIPAPYPPSQKKQVPGDPSSFSSHTVTLLLIQTF